MEQTPINRVVGIRQDGSWIELDRGVPIERAQQVRDFAVSSAVFADVWIITMASDRSSS